MNFARLELPARLPRGLRAGPAQPREEGPPFAADPRRYGGKPWGWCGARTSSLRQVLSGAGRALRIKQYLYDLGPLSALDHAALYDHYAWRMRSLPLGDGRLLWLGTDYARRPAASFLAWGTCVELRVLRGRFSDRELASLARGMRPGPAALALARTPFSSRSYWSRWGRQDRNLPISAYRPPSSLWRLRWPWAAAEHFFARASDGPRAWRAGAARLEAAGWTFDGQARFGPAARPLELQAFFRRGPGHQRLWLRRLDAEASPLARPSESRIPVLDCYSGAAPFRVRVASGPAPAPRIFVASVLPDSGPHDALWWDRSHAWLLQASSREGFGAGAMLRLLARLLGARLRYE